MKIRKPVGPSDRCGVSNAEKIFGSRGACAPLLLSPFIMPIIRKSRCAWAASAPFEGHHAIGVTPKS